METPTPPPSDDPQVARQVRRRSAPWPTSRLAWARLVAWIVVIPLVTVVAVGYVQYLERQRCRDAIVARHDIRAALHDTVGTVIVESQDTPAELRFIVDAVDEVNAQRYGHPPCAARWEIDVYDVLEARGALDRADPLVAEHLGVPTPFPPELVPDSPGERPRGG